MNAYYPIDEQYDIKLTNARGGGKSHQTKNDAKQNKKKVYSSKHVRKMNVNLAKTNEKTGKKK